MARLWSCGFELQSVTAGVEYDTTTGSPTISTSTIHGGSASFRAAPAATTAFLTHTFQSDAINTTIHRFAFNIATAPAATIKVWEYLDSANTVGFSLNLTSGRILQTVNDANATTVLGSSSALNLNQWYIIEVKIVDSAASTATMELKIDLTVILTHTALVGLAGGGRIRVGAITGTSSPVLFFDDVAVNDSTGSFQNTYPGLGYILHLYPNADGDNHGFTTQTGGTAGAANNFTRVNQITPDDVTTFNGANGLNIIDDYNIDDPTILGANDVINVAAVGWRYRSSAAAGATVAITPRAKASAGGTVETGTAVTPSGTTFKTNKNATPIIHPLIMYDMPGASTTAIKKADLTTFQIGMTTGTAQTNRADVTSIWLMVDYTPGPSQIFTHWPFYYPAIGRSGNY